MTKYQLGKLIELAGTLETRKRVQKVVYLLQARGLQFDTEFRLHHFGPYSAEVALLLNQMVKEGLLIETRHGNFAGQQFDYQLSDEAAASLRQFEQAEAGRSAAAQFTHHAARLKELLTADLRNLELASTIVFFKQKGASWSKSFEQACEFKNVQAESVAARQARQLAEAVVE